jgi:hypothetical protein
LKVAGRSVRLFLSHSSHAEGSEAVLKAVVAALTARDINVLYDKREIRMGYEWRERINAMLAGCDAAAFMLTGDALASEWVLKEANILRWRRSRSTDFRILPVLYGALDDATREASDVWRELADLQCGQAETADEVAEIIADKLASLTGNLDPTPLEVMAGDIEQYLAQRVHPARLQRAVQELGEDVPWDSDGRSSPLAFRIARWMLSQPPPALEVLAVTLKQLVSESDRATLLEYVLPLWVDPAAATWLTPARELPAGCHGVGIACTRPADTVDHFLRRAHVPDEPPPVLWMNAIGDGADAADIEVELKLVVAKHLERRSRRTPLPIDVERACQRPWLVALPLPTDPGVIGDLQDRHKNLTFIFWAPFGADVEAPSASAVAWVDPRLEPDDEQAVWDDYYAAVA